MSTDTILTFWLPVVLIVNLHASLNVQDDTRCSYNGPGNCTFTSDFCHWNNSGWTTNVVKRHIYKCAYLSFYITSGFLTSRPVCATSPAFHCLKFEYYIKESDTYALEVFISWPHNGSRLELWNSSTKATWGNAEIPVKPSDSTFTLMIKGTRKHSGERNKKVRVRNLKYYESRCNDGLTTTSSSSTNTIDTKLPTTSTASLGKHTTASAGKTAGEAAKSNVWPTITGVSATIFISSIILVFLIIFFRRNNLMCWKIRSGEKPAIFQTDLASDAEDYDISTGVSRDDNHTGDTPPSNHYTSVSEASTSRLSVENYSVIRDVDQDESSLAFRRHSSLYCLAQDMTSSTPSGTDNPAAAHVLDSPEISGDNRHQDGAQVDDYSEMRFDEEQTYSNYSPCDHVHTTHKAMAKQKQCFMTKVAGQQPQQCAFGERIPQTPEATAATIYHILEQRAEHDPCTQSISWCQHHTLEETLHETETRRELRDTTLPFSQSPTSDSSPSPREEATDYNHLQFDRSEPVENVTGVVGGGDVYSHVKEGGENTYDEVDRDRQRDVIDDDYSHIW
ncbi:uncharacterized protein LOC143300569 [Babylonia areolata]|uniref:uncharacterized protein LOC143300569 n=1 Tax=Babylonia areolata TaxID=304850 RepID=UPI003FD01BBD